MFVKLYHPFTLVVVVKTTFVDRFFSSIVQPERPGSPLLMPLLLRSLNFTPQTDALFGWDTILLPKFWLVLLPGRVTVKSAEVVGVQPICENSLILYIPWKSFLKL